MHSKSTSTASAAVGLTSVTTGVAAMARRLYKEAFYWKAVAAGRFGGVVIGPPTKKVTVVVPCYHAIRSRNLDPIVRNALRCAFVERVVLSNHNPSVNLEERVSVRSDRLSFVTHPVRRGCGQGWIVASQTPSDYYLVIDDDTILRPQQLAALLQELLDDPAVPHGLAGWLSHGQFVERQNGEADCLFNVYAVTRQHVDTYVAYVDALVSRWGVAVDTVEFFADDIVISQTGPRRARLHDLGWFLRCRSSNHEGVAMSKDPDFWAKRQMVEAALAKVKVSIGKERPLQFADHWKQSVPAASPPSHQRDTTPSRLSK